MYKKVGLSQSSLCETPSSINRMATPVVTAPVDVQPLGTRDSVHSYERGRCYFRRHVLSLHSNPSPPSVRFLLVHALVGHRFPYFVDCVRVRVVRQICHHGLFVDLLRDPHL
jgi:hypothetical protein